MDIIMKINGFINEIVWGVPMLILILGTGLYFTIRLHFFQFRYPRFLLRQTILKALKKDGTTGKGEVTSFQAAMTSVGAIVGSGNIAGVATAIVLGGPGALVWMVVAALLGAATKFAEIALGIRYRKLHPDGTVSGGAMHYLADGLKKKWLGTLFSFLVIPYAFVISAVVDSNSIALTLQEQFSIPTVATGIVLAVVSGTIVFGGVSRIGRASEIIAPIMGGCYILAGIAVILLNISSIPEAVSSIVQGAFNPKAVTGGAVGSVFVCMRYGIARGVYSNEAGLGTAAMIHCGAKVEHPVEQAIWGPVEVFLDTVLVCSVTALTIVLSGLYDSGYDGAVLTMRAFEVMLPGSIGAWVCTSAVLLFGFTCIISYYTYAERASVYLFGEKSRKVIRVLWIVATFVGTQTTLGFAWDLADTVNGLMIIPNLIGILLLSNQVVKMKDDYFVNRLR